MLSCSWCMKPITEGSYYRHPMIVGEEEGVLLCPSCEAKRERELDRKEVAATGMIHCTECSKTIMTKEEVVGYPQYDWTGRLKLLYYCQACLARVQGKSE